MKFRYLLLSFLFILTFTAFSQICKYEKNEIDPITDEVIRVTKTRITSPTPYYITTFYRYGDKYQIKINVGDNGELTHTIKEGSEMIIRTGSGEIIRVNANEDAEPKVTTEYGEKSTEFIVTYDVPEEEMKKIAKSGIAFIRATDLKNMFSDLKVPDVVTELIQHDVECLCK